MKRYPAQRRPGIGLPVPAPGCVRVPLTGHLHAPPRRRPCAALLGRRWGGPQHQPLSHAGVSGPEAIKCPPPPSPFQGFLSLSNARVWPGPLCRYRDSRQCDRQRLSAARGRNRPASPARQRASLTGAAAGLQTEDGPPAQRLRMLRWDRAGWQERVRRRCDTGAPTGDGQGVQGWRRGARPKVRRDVLGLVVWKRTSRARATSKEQARARPRDWVWESACVCSCNLACSLARCGRMCPATRDASSTRSQPTCATSRARQARAASRQRRRECRRPSAVPSSD